MTAVDAGSLLTRSGLSPGWAAEQTL